MAILKSQCRNIREEPGTLGGTTYHVKLPGGRESKALCFRKLHGKLERCTNPAGYNTDHPGTGACKFHGGRNKGAYVTGKGAFKTRMRLDGKIQEYLGMDRDKLLDLSYQLAATKAMFDEFIEHVPGPDEDNYGIGLMRFQGLIGTLSTLVEKISKIENRNTLTSAQVLYLRATIADLLMKYISDPEMRERAIRELAARMGGDIQVELQPYEYNSLPSGNQTT